MTPYLLREEIQGLRDKWGRPSPGMYGELSDLLFKAGKIPAALNLMEHSLSFGEVELHSFEDFAEALHSLGRKWFARGLEYADACLYEEAHACFLKSLAAGHENFEAYYCLAGVEKSLGRLEAAKNHCEKSLEYNPGFSPALLLLGSIAKLEGRFEESVEALQKARLINPDCATIQYDLACYYALAGEEASALATLETAVEKGFCDFEWLTRDPDLASLHSSPEFSLILHAHLSKKA